MPALDLIDHYCQHLVELGRSERTIETQRGILIRMDNELPYGLDEAEDDEIKKWIHRPIWSRQTKCCYLAAAHGFYQFCVHENRQYLSRDPSASCPRPKIPKRLPKPISNDRLSIVLGQARQPIRLWCTIAAYEGARCIEISRMDRDQITETETYLYGKGDKERVVPTHPLVWNAVKDLPTGPIARNSKDGRAAPQEITVRAIKEFRRLGLPRGISMHNLRHWYGTHIHAAVGDIRVTQEAMGHASPNTTAAYTAIANARLRAAVAALPTV